MFRFPLLQAGEHFPSAEHKLDKRKHFSLCLAFVQSCNSPISNEHDFFTFLDQKLLQTRLLDLLFS